MHVIEGIMLAWKDYANSACACMKSYANNACYRYNWIYMTIQVRKCMMKKNHMSVYNQIKK